jgi:CRP-like cAMP-binding protein
VEDVYFPLSGAVSVIVMMEDGTMMEPGIIGREGMLGFPFGIGDDLSRWRSIVQLSGEAVVLSRETMRDLMVEANNLAPLLTHCAGLLVALVAQSAACSQFHSNRERCGRWLLLMHDRADADDFPLTQEYLAGMLGTHRPAVTVALGQLREEGLVETARGTVRVLDRAGLEASVCECYRRVQMKYEESVEVGERRSAGQGHAYTPDE